MSSPLQKKSFTLMGHPTSVALEAEFWHELAAIAHCQNISLTALVASIDTSRAHSLASALRIYVITHLKSADKSAKN